MYAYNIFTRMYYKVLYAIAFKRCSVCNKYYKLYELIGNYGHCNKCDDIARSLNEDDYKEYLKSLSI